MKWWWGQRGRRREGPEAGAEVDGDSAARVVDEEAEFEGFDEQGDEGSGDEADEDGREGREKSAAGRTADEAGDPAIGAEGSVGLAVAKLGGRRLLRGSPWRRRAQR